MSAFAGWRAVREVGPSWGIRLLITLAITFGRTLPRWLLRPIVAWYWATNAGARRASREYLRRIGLAPTPLLTFSHLLCFAECALDRLFFLRNRTSALCVESVDTDVFNALRSSSRGAIVLGAHLGSFEALRALSTKGGLRLNVVGWFHGTQRLNQALFENGDAAIGALIDAAEGPLAVGLRVREAVERGEVVAMLADRAGFGRSVPAQFLGGTVQLPSGPYALAATLRCPVYLAFALYTPPNRYRLYCELLTDCIEIDRRTRDVSLQRWAQRYADRLEHYCRLSPLAWFNFFDYWPENPPA